MAAGCDWSGSAGDGRSREQHGHSGLSFRVQCSQVGGAVWPRVGCCTTAPKGGGDTTVCALDNHPSPQAHAPSAVTHVCVSASCFAQTLQPSCTGCGDPKQAPPKAYYSPGHQPTLTTN